MDGQVAAYGVLTDHFFGSRFIEMLMVGGQFRRNGLGLALNRTNSPRVLDELWWTGAKLPTLLSYYTCQPGKG
jgi:hypothetical protein